jgi:hypothetical protein
VGDGSYDSVLVNPKIRGATRTRLVEAASEAYHQR